MADVYIIGALEKERLPLPPPDVSGNVILLSTTGKAKAIIFKVAKWDPNKHPKGYKGLFIETPDKIKATEAKAGDVLATKSGKVFKVEKQTEKGVKVNPVNVDTGEVQETYTVLGNDVSVAVVEGGKAAGSIQTISELEPGTYIKHPTSGNRFVIGKQGNWTTVYPVDNDGNKVGKHTVLKPDTKVEVTAKAVSDDISPSQVAAIQTEAAELPPVVEVPLDPSPIGAAFFGKFWQEVSAKYPDIEEDQWMGMLVAELQDFDPNKPVSATVDEILPQFTAFNMDDDREAFRKQLIDTLNVTLSFEISKQAPPSIPEQIEEIMPVKVPKVPKKYPDGVGKDTRVVIEIGTKQWVNPEHKGWGYDAIFYVRRVDSEGNEQLIGVVSGVGAARKLARTKSAPHEPIEEMRYDWNHGATEASGLYWQRISLNKKIGALLNDAGGIKAFKEGMMVTDTEGKIGEITAISQGSEWSAGLNDPHEMTIKRADGEEDVYVFGVDNNGLFAFTGNTRVFPIDIFSEDTIANIKQIDEETKISNQMVSDEDHIVAKLPANLFRNAMEDIDLLHVASNQIRTARPNKYVSELQHEWSLDEIAGAQWEDAHKQLKALGWREIKPRQKGYVRYINAKGRRLTVFRDSTGKITAVNQHKLTGAAISGQSGRELFDTLTKAMAEGSDISALDPQNNIETVLRNNHVQQMIFDMALGHQNGVGAIIGKGGKSKIKTDQQYMEELDAEGKIGPVEDYMDKVETPKAKLTGLRGSIISRFGLDADPSWDFTTRSFEIPDDFTDEEAAALKLILTTNGVASQVIGENGGGAFETEIIPELKAADPIEGARKMAAFAASYVAPEPEGLIDELVGPNTAATFITSKIKALTPDAAFVRKAAEGEHVARANALRAKEVQTEIDARRKKEGTLKSATNEFDLPVWDEIKMEEQSFESIEDRVSKTEPAGVFQAITDVPAFYAGGMVKDGVLAHRADDTWGKVMVEHDEDMISLMEQLGAELIENPTPIKPGQAGSYHQANGKAFVFYDGSKRIEYVPHDDSQAGGAPTSQRGRLTLFGYSPHEAAKQLQELGVVGELEPEVPYDSIMRSARRTGLVVPLHPAYVRGEADLPHSNVHLTHGLTGSGDKSAALDSILDTGGVLSIEQRYRAGFLQKMHTASPWGDIRSGIDHAVFVGFGDHGGCGGGSSFRFVLKPSAILVRDITMAPQDFGPSETRYPHYKSFLNKLQKEVGVPTTNIYQPVDPKVRQLFLTGTSKSGSAEFNIGPAIVIEDMKAISVPAANVESVRMKLNQLLAEGKVASIPEVIPQNDFAAAATKPIKGAKIEE